MKRCSSLLLETGARAVSDLQREVEILHSLIEADGGNLVALRDIGHVKPFHLIAILGEMPDRSGGWRRIFSGGRAGEYVGRGELHAQLMPGSPSLEGPVGAPLSRHEAQELGAAGATGQRQYIAEWLQELGGPHGVNCGNQSPRKGNSVDGEAKDRATEPRRLRSRSGQVGRP